MRNRIGPRADELEHDGVHPGDVVRQKQHAAGLREVFAAENLDAVEAAQDRAENDAEKLGDAVAQAGRRGRGTGSLFMAGKRI